MPINLERWKNQEDLTSQNFNRRLLELETHFNSLAEKNTKLEEENTNLKKLLDNKVEKTDKTVYKKLQDVQGTDVDILVFAKNLKASGFFQLFYQNKNVPTTGNWDWAYAELIYQNNNAIHLKLTALFPPYSTATCHYINGAWQSWVVV
jgi:hypothetical protein